LICIISLEALLQGVIGAHVGVENAPSLLLAAVWFFANKKKAQ
jgi:hypothetical protein